jgi:formamidopyrimidine-DNA glycosylase
MPELPEAETIVRDLRSTVTGRKVTGVEVARSDVLAPGLRPATLAKAIRGRRIESVDRRGKNVVLRFDDEERLVVNLGMTGRLVFAETPDAAGLRHVAVRLDLDRGGALFYDDIRRFGRVALHTPETWQRFDHELGIEPLSREFTAKRLHELTRGSRTPIRNWLLDQQKIAGVGNIYANEALFRARIHPARPANSLDADEAARLHDGIRSVLKDAIEKRGTTVSDYRDGKGETGGFEPYLQAYGREGKPCPRCGTPIERVSISNRSAFFCPHCQRM